MHAAVDSKHEITNVTRMLPILAGPQMAWEEALGRALGAGSIIIEGPVTSVISSHVRPVSSPKSPGHGPRRAQFESLDCARARVATFNGHPEPVAALLLGSHWALR